MLSKTPFIAELLERLAPRLDARLYLEPEQQRLGYIQFSNGRRCFFRDNRFDLNTLGAVNVARDKAFCSVMLRHFGYNAPSEISFWKPQKFPSANVKRDVNDAVAFALSAGFPVYVKPNNRSQGLAVFRASNEKELRKAAQKVFEVADVALVQPAYPGRDYRLVVLGRKVISAYERIPLEVTGDGHSTIRELLAKESEEFIRRDRDTTIRVTAEMQQRLRRHGLTLQSRPKAARVVRLTDIANLSVGGGSRDVTDEVHPYYRKLAGCIASDLNLHFCGIDLITSSVQRPCRKHVVLEVNASPGLDNYALPDANRQREAVDELYLQVLRYIQAGNGGP